MIYGHDKTVHKTEKLNVEVDSNGKVVAVWFRCLPLPFDQSVASENRAEDMQAMYATTDLRFSRLLAVEVADREEVSD